MTDKIGSKSMKPMKPNRAIERLTLERDEALNDRQEALDACAAARAQVIELTKYGEGLLAGADLLRAENHRLNDEVAVMADERDRAIRESADARAALNGCTSHSAALSSRVDEAVKILEEDEKRKKRTQRVLNALAGIGEP